MVMYSGELLGWGKGKKKKKLTRKYVLLPLEFEGINCGVHVSEGRTRAEFSYRQWRLFAALGGREGESQERKRERVSACHCCVRARS